MSITKDWLDGVSKKTLVHKGAKQTPRLLVIHYSVTDTVAQAVTALNKSKLSYHVLIEKDGKAYQTRPFTETAAHPGRSNWKAAGGVKMGSSVQAGSIGVCLMNKGYAFGTSQSQPGKLIYNPDDATMQRWEVYPNALIQSCQAIAKDIIDTYGIAEVVGHHDVAIMGKFDPGPLFDLDALNAMVDTPIGLGFETTIKSKTELRKTASPSGDVIGALKKGDRVFVRSIAYGPKSKSLQPSPSQNKRYLTRWASVDITGGNRHSGFVDMKFLKATPLEPQLAQFL